MIRLQKANSVQHRFSHSGYSRLPNKFCAQCEANLVSGTTTVKHTSNANSVNEMVCRNRKARHISTKTGKEDIEDVDEDAGSAGDLTCKRMKP